MRPTALFFAIALLSAVASPAAACRNVRMKNDTGQTVNDLHFETNQGNQDVSFADLADGQRVIVTLRGPTSPECQNIKILKWWWTKDSVMVGLKKDGEPEARFSVNGGPAAGSGQIRIRSASSSRS
jgi:hypothetical protein